MHIIKKHHPTIIPILFMLGLILPFNGFWLSGLFYFALTWFGLVGFLFSFKLELLLHCYILIGFAVPIFTLLSVLFFAIYKLSQHPLSATISKITGLLSILAYLSYISLTVTDILMNDFSLSFFNQTLWFISALLCVFSLFKWSKDATMLAGDNHNAIY